MPIAMIALTMPGAEHRRQHDGRQDGRKGEAEVGHPHDDFLDPAALRRREQAESGADDEADADGDDADQRSRRARPPAAATPTSRP